jgi:hypothetical protein
MHVGQSRAEGRLRDALCRPSHQRHPALRLDAAQQVLS